MGAYNLVVGAGFSGATIAREIAERLGEPVVVVEQRSTIGGNCHDYIDTTGVRVPSFGPHFFHTDSERVWNYVQRFGEWNDYQHRVLSKVGDRLVPVPVNITTVNTLFGLDLRDTGDMHRWLERNTESIDEPTNSEEVALSRVGKQLYESMFRNYTQKQWGMEPRYLDPSVMARIPVRTDFEDRYFTDRFQGMPVAGYTALVTAILDDPNIDVRLGLDYCHHRPEYRDAVRTFFTGRIDDYFADVIGERLSYRSLRFELERHDTEWFQPVATVNYPEPNVPWTRITEPKHSTGQDLPRTVTIKEYPAATGEPYYPVLDDRNKTLFARFQELAAERESERIFYVGRLAQYQYFNMDQAIENALEFIDRLRD